MAILRVYVASTCIGCVAARRLVQQLHAARPAQPIELIDIERAGALRPAYIFGTPTYCIENTIISLGNPTLGTLLAAIDQFDAQVATPSQAS